MIKYSIKAGKVVTLILETIGKQIRPGMTGKDLESIAVSIMKSNNCKSSSLGYGGFPASICVSINDELTHGIPDHRFFKAGDLISVDVACSYRGFHADAASTFFLFDKEFQVDDSELESKLRLINVTRDCLLFAIDSIVPNKTTTQDIGSIIQEYVEKNGFYSIKEYGGHGIGRMLHMDPFIPNYRTHFTGTILKPGMIICIEPLVQIGDDKIKISPNQRTVSSKNGFLNAHFEHTILIKDDGVEIIA